MDNVALYNHHIGILRPHETLEGHYGGTAGGFRFELHAMRDNAGEFVGYSLCICTDCTDRPRCICMDLSA